MLRSKNVDVTGGPIISSVLVYSIPVIVGALIQVLFNAADLMVVGQMTTDDIATAAVGATSSIVGLLVNSFVGLSAGVSVVLARCIGQGDEIRTRRVLYTSVITSFAVGLLVCGICLLAARPMLSFTDCPEECIEDSVLYLKIYAIGIPAMMVYNFGAAIIRTTGDTQKPLYYLIIAGIANVVFNFLFCLVLERKVAAVAIATAISQLIGAVLVMIHLCRINGPCRFTFKNAKFSFSELIVILKIGIPCGLNSALFSLANLQIQAQVNSFGPSATAGGAAAASLEGAVSSFGNFSAAALPFVGQNVGAGNRRRVRDSIITCSVLAFAVSLISGLIIYAFGDQVLFLFLPNSPEAVAVAKSRMLFIMVPFCLHSVSNVLVSAMQAFGYSLIPMINSILAVLGFRTLWIQLIYPILDAANRDINNVYMCYTISYVLSLVAHFITFMIIYSRYKKGKMRKV